MGFRFTAIAFQYIRKGKFFGGRLQRFAQSFLPLLACFGLLACSSGEGSRGEVELVEGFAGLVAADEPNTAVVGRDVLGQNGSAFDAAVAMGFTMAVTLPSRAGLGGGGVCVVQSRSRVEAKAIMFPPLGDPQGAIALPATGRGLALLHARFGTLDWRLLVAPAERLARFGHLTSRALHRDIAKHISKVAANEQLGDLLLDEQGSPIEVGERLVQFQLASILSGIRERGGAYMHSGSFVRRLEDSLERSGLTFDPEALRTTLPRMEEPLAVEVGANLLYLPTGSVNGGPQAAGLWEALESQWSADSARAQAALNQAAQQFYQGGGNAAVDASAGFVVADRFGDAVACSFTMNQPFGSGIVAPQTGLLLAAPPEGKPSLTALLLGNNNSGNVRMGIAGSDAAGLGLEAIRLALDLHEEGRPLQQAIDELRISNPILESRLTAFYCPDGVYFGEEEGCQVASDPLGNGLAQIAR